MAQPQPRRFCRSLVATALATAVLALGPVSATCAQITNTGGPAPTLRKSAFDLSVHQALSGKVMGYSFLLMKNGQVVTEDAGGKARNEEDGFLTMTPDTPQNLGSLFKFVSGVTMLHVLERPPAGSAGGDNTFQARLNAPTALLYPQVWQSAIKVPQIRTITFKQYLQHKSGFRGCSGGMLGCLGGSFNPRLIGSRDYQNINFSVTGFMIGVYTKPSILPATNGLPADRPVADREKFFQLAAGQQMDQFIRGPVFAKVPGKISASCDASSVYRKNGAYVYKAWNDSGAGVITSRPAVGEPCIGSGGYWMSIRDFAAFVATALHSDRLLSARTRALLYREPMDPDDRMVWSFTTQDAWIENQFGMKTIVYSGGDLKYGTGQATHTALVRLPLEYEALVFINSNDMDSGALARVAINAFRAGMEHNFQ